MKIILTDDSKNYFCPIDKLTCLGNKCMAWRDWCQHLNNREVVIRKDYGYCSYVHKGEKE